ncbi:MAG: L,D-transpeptidase family protein [Sedimenticola sp.]|nr:L,D-transpeptidase family protein [Sedimenticola sp.]
MIEKYRQTRILLTPLLVLLWLAPLQAEQPGQRSLAPVTTLQSLLLSGENLALTPTPDWALLRQVYRERPEPLLWHAPTGELSDAGLALLQFILEIDRHGLERRSYHLDNLGNPLLTRAQRIARNDLLLSDGFLRLARHLARGEVDPDSVDPLWKIPRETVDAGALLRQALERQNPVAVLESLAPQSEEYRKLQQALAEYREMADQAPWSKLPPAPLIRPGDRHPLIPLLRRRLAASGHLLNGDSDEPKLYDPLLQATVESFQRQHGLKADAIIGPDTRAALNVTPQQRAAQIRANLERWRWLPPQLGDRYLLVNIGGYRVQLVENGQVRMEKRAIIGRPMRSTPSFSTRVTHLVANPTWTVPWRIAVEDLLPEQKRDSEYLLRKNIQVQQQVEDGWVDLDPAMVDWTSYNRYHFPFRLRQAPGDGNSLGRIKFHMPNPYSIYLHDTPAQSLFQHPVRDFSSGCVRVEEIGDLADHLYNRNTETQQLQPLGDILNARQPRYLKLENPIDVFLVYFTSWVDLKGTTQFRPDIYNLDAPLTLALQQLHRAPGAQLAYRENRSRD